MKLFKWGLSKKDKEFLVWVLHNQQDMWAETESDLAGTDLGPEDRKLYEDVLRWQDKADELRERLGDPWKPTFVTDDALHRLIEKES